MGVNWGTSFVRITDPENPVVVAYLSTKYVSSESPSKKSKTLGFHHALQDALQVIQM